MVSAVDSSASTAASWERACYPAGIQSGLSVTNEACDRIAYLGSDSMPVNFPIRPHMPQKSSPFVQWQGLPNLLRYRSESIDYSLPIDPSFRCCPNLLAHQ